MIEEDWQTRVNFDPGRIVQHLLVAQVDRAPVKVHMGQILGFCDFCPIASLLQHIYHLLWEVARRNDEIVVPHILVKRVAQQHGQLEV